MPGLRILMIAPTSFFSDTGCHVRILEEARALGVRGHEVSVCTYRKGRDPGGFPVYRTLPLPWRQHYEVGSSRHKFAYDALLVLTVLERALRHRPDVIHAHMHEGALIGSVIGRLLHIPVVFDFQGSASSEMVDHHFLNPRGPWYRPMVRLERLIDHLPQALVTSTHNAARLLVEDFACDPGHITVVQDRVNSRTFHPDVLTPEERRSLRESLSIPGDSLLVVYLGLLAEHQGTSLLLRAATRVVAEVPRAHFLIMGYPGVNEYRAYAHSLGLAGRVVFTGQLPYDRAPHHLALGDLAVAPKVSATEGAGKLLNYMAMALPVVAFDGPVNREYLGELGIYPDAVDEAALSSTLIRVLGDLEGARSLGQALRQRALERFTWEEGAAAIEAVYERVLSPQGRGRRLRRSRPQVEQG
ncbi:MAG: glycosyltransferase family 4 protein [Anaerolineae bacterium]|nr:glycosyltransferase family 4 protein [Anaerolineae bacterium]